MRNKMWFLCGCLATVLAFMGVQQTWGAAATWSEEMDDFPNTGPAGQVWAGWDDAGGGNGQVWSNPSEAGGLLEQVVSFDGATGVWKIPGGAYNWHDMGMAVADEGDPDTLDDNSPNSPITTPQFTYEVRYRINRTLGDPLDNPGVPTPIDWPTVGVGNLTAYPVQFMASPRPDVAPGFRVAVGYTNSDGDAEINGYYQTHMNEGIGAWSGVNHVVPAAQTGAPPMDTWQTIRVTSTFDAANGGTGTYDVHLNGVLLHSFDLTGIQPPPAAFTRSVGVQRQAVRQRNAKQVGSRTRSG